MADETSTYAIELRDETSGPAKDAAAALEKLRQKIDADQKSLRAMHAAMARLKGGTVTNVAAFRQLRERITAQKSAIAKAQGEFTELGGTFETVTEAATEVAESGLGDLLKAAQKTPGPIGALVSRIGGLKGLLAGGPLVAGALGLAAGFLAVAAASAALVTAVAAATAQLLRFGIVQADARRSERLALEGLVRRRTWTGLAAGSASELQSAIDRVSDSTATGRGEVSGYAQQLYRMGLRGDALSEALEGVAITTSVMGEAAGRRFAGMAAGAARTGRSVRALADDVRARLGGIAGQQALSLDRQFQQLRENAGRIFETLKIEGFLRALRQVTSLFSQSTASGRALRQLVEVLFQPMLDGLADAGPAARRFFQGMILGAQRLTIGVLRLRNRFLSTFGGGSVMRAIDLQSVALNAGTAIVVAFAAAVVTAGVVLGGLAAIVGVVAAGVAVLAAPLILAGAALYGVIEAGRQVLVWWENTDWAKLGTAIVSGLVNGLRQGRALVQSSIRSLATEATRALRESLQIRSPSRVFADLGRQIPRGLAAGVEAGAPAATGAVEAVVSVPDAAGGGRGSAAASGRSVTIGDIHVHVGQTDQPRQIGQAIVDEIVRALEGVGIELGAAAA